MTSLKSYRGGRETRVTTHQPGSMAKSVDIACREDAKGTVFGRQTRRRWETVLLCKGTRRPVDLCGEQAKQHVRRESISRSASSFDGPPHQGQRREARDWLWSGCGAQSVRSRNGPMSKSVRKKKEREKTPGALGMRRYADRFQS